MPELSHIHQLWAGTDENLAIDQHTVHPARGTRVLASGRGCFDLEQV
jgi:hypothetical protein